MKLMKTTFLEFGNNSYYSINLTINDSPFSLDFIIFYNKLDIDAEHWNSMYKVKGYVIS